VEKYFTLMRKGDSEYWGEKEKSGGRYIHSARIGERKGRECPADEAVGQILAAPRGGASSA
jgi:hypothetical protein